MFEQCTSKYKQMGGTVILVDQQIMIAFELEIVNVLYLATKSHGMELFEVFEFVDLLLRGVV